MVGSLLLHAEGPLTERHAAQLSAAVEAGGRPDTVGILAEGDLYVPFVVHARLRGRCQQLELTAGASLAQTQARRRPRSVSPPRRPIGLLAFVTGVLDPAQCEAVSNWCRPPWRALSQVMHPPMSIRCRDCGFTTPDRRWDPLCPACHEGIRHEQRRLQVRPPAVDLSPWLDPPTLTSSFEHALGPPLQ